MPPTRHALCNLVALSLSRSSMSAHCYPVVVVTTVKSLSPSKYTIYPSDCAAVIAFLETQPGTFSVPPRSYSYWYHGSCTLYFLNFDTITYRPCFSAFTYNAYATASACLGKTNGGTCTAQTQGNPTYQIVVGSEDTPKQNGY